MKERPAIKMRLMILLIAVLMDYTSSSCPSNCPEAPYHIIEPSTDNDVQIVSPSEKKLILTCTLNATIPGGVMITWSLNGDVLNTFTTTKALNTIQYFGGTPQSGVYQCLFNDSAGYIVRGNITVIVIDIVQPSMDFHTVTIGESTRPVQLMCSLNINISSNVTVTWLHNDTLMTSPDDVTQAGSTTTLVIRNPQPSDVGIYQCVFNDSVDGWILKRNIGLSPYYIIQPPTDDFVQTVFSTAANITLKCSLNVNIPASMTITWLYHSDTVMSLSRAIQVGQTTVLQLSSPQDGIYQCIFNDTDGYILSRNMTLLVVDIVRPSRYTNTVTFYESESSVQVMCSLNINIPSNVTVTWLHNERVVTTTEYDENSNTTTTTLAIRNPQSDDDYVCIFTDMVNGWTLSRDIILRELSVTTTVFDPTSTYAGSTFAGVTPASTNATLTATITSSTSTFITAPSVLSITTIPPITTDSINETSSSSDINIGVIVAPIIIIIVVAIVIVALIIAFYWWRRKKQLYDIDKVMLQKSPTIKEEPVYSEINDGQNSKEPQYMEISTKKTENVAMEDNPAYSVTAEHQIKMDTSKNIDPTKQVDKVMMQDNPAYSASSECQINMQDNPAYSALLATKQ